MQSVLTELSYFMVYNSTLGPKEGEEEKRLLYYYPDSEKPYKKINNVGLCEALVQFSKTFSVYKSCENLQTLYHQHFFYEAEPEFWIVMSITNPTNGVENDDKNEKEKKLWDGVYHTLLVNIYKRFCLLNGTFLHVIETSNIKTLKEQLRFFLNRHLKQKDLLFCDILTGLSSISYPTLEKSVVLAFQSFLCGVQDRFKNIKHGLVLSDNFLILSDLNSEDTQTVVKFLREKLKLDLPFSKRSKAITNSRECQPLQLRFGRFFLEFFRTFNSKNNAFLNCSQTNRSVKKLEVCVYQAFNLTLCTFLDNTQNIGLLQQIDAFVGPQLANLSSRISTNLNTPTVRDPIEPNLRHIFCDHLTLASESSCHSIKNDKLTFDMPTEVMHVICTVSLNFKQNNFTEEEVIMKVQNEYWVAAKKMNTKELYVVVNQKNANLISVYESVKKISSHFDMHFSD